MKTWIIAEIGLNHQGDIKIAKQLIDVAIDAGADMVKFQKRTPEVCLPEHLWGVEKDTPFGRMSYLDYRKRIEFGKEEYSEINNHCWGKIAWTASPWDTGSVKFLSQFRLDTYKIASPMLTDLKLLKAVAHLNTCIIMSTGMSTEEQIEHAWGVLYTNGASRVDLLVCTSAYPAAVSALNLNRIRTLKAKYPGTIVGYSGHEAGLWTTLCAVAMGAEIVERHITLDRTMVGSDHASSLEPQGLTKLVKEIRNFERAVGTGLIGPVGVELPQMKSLRRYVL